MTSPIRVLRQIVAPSGKHRRIPLAELLGKPSAYTTPPVQGVLTQAWKPCSGPCGQEMPSVVHVDGSWQCGHCLTTTTAEGDQ